MIWTNVTGNTGYFKTPFAYVPYYKLNNRELVLLDSGEKEFPEIAEDIEKMGMTVKAILCSHGHHDHVSTNRLLQERFGCPVYITESGRADVRDFVRPFDAVFIPDEDGQIQIGDAVFKIVSLPGHSLGHLGFVTPDDVFYVGDSMMSERELRLSKIPYMEETLVSIQSMKKIAGLKHRFYLMAHKGYIISTDLERLCHDNIEKELVFYEDILACLQEETDFDTFVVALMRYRGIEREDFFNSPILRHTIRTRVDELIRLGCVKEEDGKMIAIQTRLPMAQMGLSDFYREKIENRHVVKKLL